MTNSKRDTGLLNERYTQQPLLDTNPDLLVCFSDDKIKKVTLTEINYHNQNNTCVILQGNNVFETFHESNHRPTEEQIHLTRFHVLTADGKEHTLIIKPDGIFYDGDLDIIHQWLVKRGFVIDKSLAVKKTFPLILSGIFSISTMTVPL